MYNLNICMCGAQSGYLHADSCPFPYYGGDGQTMEKWYNEYLAKKDQTSSEEAEEAAKNAEPDERLLDGNSFESYNDPVEDELDRQHDEQMLEDIGVGYEDDAFDY